MDERTPLLPPTGRPPVSPQSSFFRRLFHHLTYASIIPIFSHPPTSKSSLPPLPPAQSAAHLSSQILPAWDALSTSPSTLHNPRAALTRALFSSGALRPFLLAAPLYLLKDVLALASPILFHRLVKWTSLGASAPPATGLLYVATLLALLIFQNSVFAPAAMHLGGDAGIRVETSLALLIHRKSLRLSSSHSSTGKLISLLTVDVRAAGIRFLQWAHMWWSGLIQVLVGFVLLHLLLGPPAFAGIAVMLASSLLQFVLCKYVEICVDEAQSCSDARLDLLTELIAMIREIKLGNVADWFQGRVGDARRDQMLWEWRWHLVDASAWALWEVFPAIASCAMFAAARGRVDVEDVFATLAIVEVIRVPLALFPELVLWTAAARVALDRIANVLLLEEVDGMRVIEERGSAVAAWRGGNFSWSAEKDARVVLWEPVAEVPRAGLTVIEGQVGFGKSSLIAALLGEMHWLESGTGGALRPGFKRGISVSFAPQIPFIFDASLKENVVHFTRCRTSADEDRYRRVVNACALERDLLEMPEGDGTMLGSKGFQLSGGQRARVALARCLYMPADIYICDMALSSLDNATASHVFESVWGKDGLLEGKSCILVAGSSFQICWVNNRLHFYKPGRLACIRSLPPAAVPAAAVIKHEASFPNCLSAVAEKYTDNLETVSESSDSACWYVGFGGVLVPVIVSVVLFLSIGSLLVQDAYIAMSSSRVGYTLSTRNYVFALGGVALCSVSLQFAYRILAASHFIRIATNIHQRMLLSLFAAKSSFYDSTPASQLLNRFAGDIDAVDGDLSSNLMAVTQSFLTLIILGSASIFISPMAAVCVVPAVIYFLKLAVKFAHLMRHLQVLRSAAESPLLSAFQEGLDESGGAVIRAAQLSELQREKFMDRLDIHNQVYIVSSNSANRFLDVRASAIGAVAMSGVGCACVFSTVAGSLSPRLIGLTLLWSFKMILHWTWIPFLFGAAESALVKAGRIRNYLNCLPREAAQFEADDLLTESTWRGSGFLEVRRVCLRYQDGLPLALNELSLSVPGGSRLGIAGRTGSGKSTLLAAIARSTEIESGEILLDGVNLRNLGLKAVRNKIAFLPQNATVWSGAVRQNCDPHGSMRDAEIWTALEEVQAHHCVEMLGGLDGLLASQGNNVSPGERQLLALARILCRYRSAKKELSVLIVDEGSSQLDDETMRGIQRVLDDCFPGVTLIIIAHRLETMLSCDNIVVISDGSVVEGPASPQVLLRSNGPFQKLSSHLR